MTDIDIVANVRNVIENHTYCPCLLLGKYVTEFKKQYRGKIFHVGDLESVRDVVNNYSGIKDLEGRLFVMDGIGFLSETGQNAVLKFIEESKFPIVLLSYYDRVSPIIMSRVKFIYKRSSVPVSGLTFMKVSACIEELENKEAEAKTKGNEFSSDERNKYYAENCPIGYYLENRSSSYDFSVKKINKILSRL